MREAAGGDQARGFRPERDAYRWESVEVLEYKAEGSAPFKDVTRQVLFEEPELGFQWRYFEVAPGGHTTLERHEHVHAVMILRGAGRALVGERIHPIHRFALFRVPPMTWHQFQAGDDEPMGFLCLVPAERDRPQLPTEEDLAELRSHPEVAEYLANIAGGGEIR
jgi:S-methyl-1-thioxylulose 5-phosphate methylthiotransferase